LHKKKLQDAAQDLDGTVHEFSKSLGELRTEMYEHSHEIENMRATYEHNKTLVQKQHQRKQAFLWSGVAALIVGAGLLGGGAYALTEVDRKDAEGLPVHDIYKAREFSDISTRLFLVGGGVALVGAGLLLTGILLPSLETSTTKVQK
ncbi:MAG: hypothetical protein H6727_19665, partial [Myxococcales bacterium]|nr:hypothetical protein [Myxococcales bacterium]